MRTVRDPGTVSINVTRVTDREIAELSVSPDGLVYPNAPCSPVCTATYLIDKAGRIFDETKKACVIAWVNSGAKPIRNQTLKLIGRPYRGVIHVSAWRKCFRQK
jgi:hypothetical protein